MTSNLAPGLVWCKSCQSRTALAAAGGKCPVCDPDQVNDVSVRAQEELERIDSVLAGADTSPHDAAYWAADGSHQEPDGHPPWSVYLFGNPEWRLLEALAGYQYDERLERARRHEAQARAALDERPVQVPRTGDDVHDAFVESFVNRRVVSTRARRLSADVPGRHPMTPELRALVGDPVFITSSGRPHIHEWLNVVLEQAVPSFGADDEDRFSISPGQMWLLPQTVTIEFASGSFPRELLDLYFGVPVVEHDMALDRWEDDGGPCVPDTL